MRYFVTSWRYISTVIYRKKICVTSRDFQALMDIYGAHELQCGINVCEKNSLASIFKCWQHENKIYQDQNFHMKIYRHQPFCHILLPKSQRVFSLRVLKQLRVFILTEFSLDFTVIAFSSCFSVIGSSLIVIGSSSGS